jgi:hypothetical protein
MHNPDQLSSSFPLEYVSKNYPQNDRISSTNTTSSLANNQIDHIVQYIEFSKLFRILILQFISFFDESFFEEKHTSNVDCKFIHS